MLRFEAETVALLVGLSSLAFDGAVQKIAGIKLDAWLGCGHFQHSPAGWLYHACCQAKSFAAPVKHPIVSVALAEVQVLVTLFDARSDRGPLGEIEWSSAHGT